MSVGKKSRSNVNKIRESVFERDDYRCVVAGSVWSVRVACSSDLSLQHRVNRQRGSSAQYDFAEALLTMCSTHNVLDTSSSEFRRFCLDNGYSIERWVADPKRGEPDSDAIRLRNVSGVPVRYWDGWYALEGLAKVSLDDDEAERIVSSLYE